jgi:hypothetical protein
MQVEQWDKLVAQYRAQLDATGPVLKELSATAFARKAHEDFGGDGLPLGMVDQLDDMKDASLAEHLHDIGLDLDATAEGIRYAGEDGAEDAVALLRQYQGMLQEAQAVLQQLVDLANQHGLSSTSMRLWPRGEGAG